MNDIYLLKRANLNSSMIFVNFIEKFRKIFTCPDFDSRVSGFKDNIASDVRIERQDMSLYLNAFHNKIVTFIGKVITFIHI